METTEPNPAAHRTSQPGDERAVEPENVVLRDLALLYLALAYVDRDLENTEIDVLVARLQRWQDGGASESALSAVKHALDAYAAEDVETQRRAAVDRLRQALPEERLRAIVDDLTAIAEADDRVLHEEVEFIAELARWWDVHAGPARGARRLWSLLADDFDPTVWSPVHDLGFVYLSLAHRADGMISRSEREAIAKKLKEWLPDARQDDVTEVMLRVLKAYAAADPGSLGTSIAAVRDAVPPHQRVALLADLRYVAHADGVLLVEEQQIIARLADAWGLPLDS